MGGSGSTIGSTFFSSVPESINTLLLPAVFGANADVINNITAGNPGLWPIMVFFMALVSVTIMLRSKSVAKAER